MSRRLYDSRRGRGGAETPVDGRQDAAETPVDGQQDAAGNSGRRAQDAAETPVDGRQNAAETPVDGAERRGTGEGQTSRFGRRAAMPRGSVDGGRTHSRGGSRAASVLSRVWHTL